MESVTFYLTMVNSIIRNISLDYPCGLLLGLKRHRSRPSWPVSYTDLRAPET